MSIKRKIELFFDDYGVYIFLGLILIIAICIVIIAIPNGSISEGLVMNKLTSPTHKEKCGRVCENRWIIVIQNGDKKDWWQVSEDYFKVIDIGDWVKK